MDRKYAIVLAAILCLTIIAYLVLPSVINADSDNDGLRNSQERSIGTDPNNPDSDSDGLLDGAEIEASTNPMLSDTDNDGLDDGSEIEYLTDPTKADTDNDGLNDGNEINFDTDPINQDTDNDGLIDGDEVSLGTSPVDYDSDSDGLSDGVEIALNTDPMDLDSDDDGLSDGYEVNSYSTNPLDRDTDRDGLSDKEEQNHMTNPLISDTDGDGKNDYQEITLGTNPLKPDVTTIIYLIDEETSLSINDVRVYIDGVDKGITTQQGSIMGDLECGTYRLRISIEDYGDLDVGYFEIVKDVEEYFIDVDMPNPNIRAVITDYHEHGIDRKCDFNVKISNLGEMPSYDTYILISIYDPDDDRIMAQDYVHIGSIPKGEFKIHSAADLDSQWGAEHVSVVVFNRYRYLPTTSLYSYYNTSESWLASLVNQLVDYIENNPDVIIGKIIDAILFSS